MEKYIKLMNHILDNGNVRGDRTGTGTTSVFGYQERFNLADGFPLLTTKKMFVRGIIHELLWFLQGDTNNNTLAAEGVKIWNEWACEDGELGPIYGKQWRSWQGKVIALSDVTPTSRDLEQIHMTATPVRYQHDQISELIEGLKKKPFSRRHIVSAWNVEDLPDESISPQANVEQGRMALAPCHCLFQFYVQELNHRELAKIITDRNLDTEFKEVSKKSFEKYFETQLSNADEFLNEFLEKHNLPKYKLSCQLYQR